MIGTAAQIIIWLTRQQPGEKLFEIKEKSKRKSLSQNAYYWELNGQLARKLHISKARLHNLLLRQCAPPEMVCGKIAETTIPDTEEAEEKVLEAETYHLKPTSGVITGSDGTVYRWYMNLRGSKTFNVEEMTALINCLVTECHEQGIETLTPVELERMRENEYRKEQRKAQKDESVCDNTEGPTDS